MPIQPPPKQINYLLLLLVIALGVFLGNLGYDLFRASSGFHVLDSLVSPRYSADPADKETSNGRSAAYEQALQTCEFWKAEFRQDSSSYNRTMMTTACAKLHALE